MYVKSASETNNTKITSLSNSSMNSVNNKRLSSNALNEIYFDLKQRLNSEDVPYDITKIFTVNNDKLEGKIGKVSVAMCPGRKDCKYNRDIIKDLERIKENKVDVIICLLEWSELERLYILSYPIKAQEFGFNFFHLPIKDLGTADPRELDVIVPLIIGFLLESKHILIHCKSGYGRAGTITACCLTHFGFEPCEAISIVRSKRPRSVQTSSQEDSVHNYHEYIIDLAEKN